MSDEKQVTTGTYGDDVVEIRLGDRQILLVGTAHISQESVDLVRTVIETEKPDRVCVELDAQRYEALSTKTAWEKLDLRQVIKKKQLATLLMNILLSSYQKRLGLKLGVMPGSELLEATRVAHEHEIPISLCDRDIRVTLRRAWRALGFFKKIMLVSSLFASAFEDEELSEEDLANIRQKDVLNELMKELGQAMPGLKRVLIDERDSYLAQKIVDSEGQRIVAIVGAGHVAGMQVAIEESRRIDLDEINTIPPIAPIWKGLGWGIPTIILGSIGFIGYSKGATAAGENALYWFLANGIPCSIGALLAFAHPVTVIISFLAAPFTSLTPLIGAGYVAAFTQAYFRPPVVNEFQSVGEDIVKISRWWQSRLLRVFLTFLMTGFGSAIGTWVGAYEIVTNLF